ncbi:MAG: hypothetical protein ACRENS_05525 [Candidatus Eiseniibacteriota bacterium]
MSDETRRGGRPPDFGGLVAPVWFAGWLFTLGLLHLPLGRAVMALVIWPYDLGVYFRH